LLPKIKSEENARFDDWKRSNHARPGQQALSELEPESLALHAHPVNRTFLQASKRKGSDSGSSSLERKHKNRGLVSSCLFLSFFLPKESGLLGDDGSQGRNGLLHLIHIARGELEHRGN